MTGAFTTIAPAPRVLAELRFWITNLEGSTKLLVGNRQTAQTLAGELSERARR